MAEGPEGSSNTFCRVLGIGVPALEAVKDHRDASPYSLLLVALLEAGRPLTLAQVAGFIPTRRRSTG